MGPTPWPRWWCSRAGPRRSPTTAASRCSRSATAPATEPTTGRTTSRRWRRSWGAAWPLGTATRRLTARQGLRPQLRGAAQSGGHRRRKGQLAAGLRALQGFRERGVVVVSLAKRIEEVFIPGRAAPLSLAHDTPELQLLQRVRDEAHRFAITHHRIRRDRAMTASVLDDLPGVGPARKRALLAHFGSPDAILAASARSSSPCRGSRASSRARSTASCTRPASEPAGVSRRWSEARRCRPAATPCRSRRRGRPASWLGVPAASPSWSALRTSGRRWSRPRSR